jgi:hypothetical protein
MNFNFGVWMKRDLFEFYGSKISRYSRIIAGGGVPFPIGRFDFCDQKICENLIE